MSYFAGYFGVASGGGVSTNPGEGNVRAGVAYTIDDIDYTGTYAPSIVPTDGGSLALRRGLAYPSPTIRWPQAGADWPDLTGLTVTVVTDRGVVYAATAAGTSPNQTITLPLTTVQTNAMPIGYATWEVRASNGGEESLEFTVSVSVSP